MNAIHILTAMADLEEADIIAAHAPSARRTIPWKKWVAAAACLCLVAGTALLFRPDTPPAVDHITGNGVEGPAGGELPPGIDPVVYSLACFPTTETIYDVLDATLQDVTQAQAYAMAPLGAYLPEALPEGYVYGKGSLYETTMKAGHKYHLLRVTWWAGDSGPAQDAAQPTTQPSSGGELAPAPDLRDSFTLFLMDYRPQTDKTIYQPGDITEKQLLSFGGNVFHLDLGEAYLGVIPGTAQPEHLLQVLEQITAR